MVSTIADFHQSDDPKSDLEQPFRNWGYAPTWVTLFIGIKNVNLRTWPIYYPYFPVRKLLVDWKVYPIIIQRYSITPSLFPWFSHEIHQFSHEIHPFSQKVHPFSHGYHHFCYGHPAKITTDPQAFWMWGCSVHPDGSLVATSDLVGVVRASGAQHVITYYKVYYFKDIFICIYTYIHTYIPTYVRTYVRTYVGTYIHTYIHRLYLLLTYVYMVPPGNFSTDKGLADESSLQVLIKG